MPTPHTVAAGFTPGPAKHRLFWRAALLPALLAWMVILPGPTLSRAEDRTKNRSASATSQKRKIPTRRTPEVFAIEEAVVATGRINIRSYIFTRDNPPKLIGLAPSAPGAGREKKTVVVPLDKPSTTATLAEQPRPVRLAIIAASFPYKKQVEGFRAELRLRSNQAVLADKSLEKNAGGLALPSFRFLGVDLQRRELDNTGRPRTAFTSVDLTGDYKPLLIMTGRRLAPEDPSLAAVSFPGLVMPRLIEFRSPPSRYPLPEKRLALLARTIEKLKETRPSGKQKAAKDDFDPFSPRPAQRETPVGEDTELPEHCLVRVIDVTVKPGKTYEYRLRIRMANPNYHRLDVSRRIAATKELVSEWSKSAGPLTARLSPELHYYAVDEKELPADVKGARVVYRGPYANLLFNKDRMVILQAHRWVESIKPKGGGRLPIGEWVVAERFPVLRGEYVGRHERVEVPYWRFAQQDFAIATDASTTRRRPGIGVSFGYKAGGNQPEAILVDFDSGRRAEQIARRKVADAHAVEVLLLNPDGKLVLLDGASDSADSERWTRRAAVNERLRQVRDSNKPKKDKNPFGQ